MLTAKILNKGKTIFITFFIFSILGTMLNKFLNNAKQKGLVNKESLGLIVQSKRVTKKIKQQQLQNQSKPQPETPTVNTNPETDVISKVGTDAIPGVTATTTNVTAAEAPQDLDTLIQQVAVPQETPKEVSPIATVTPKAPASEPLSPPPEKTEVSAQEKMEQQIAQIALNAVDIINSRFVISYYPANTASNPKIFYAIPTEVMEQKDTSLSDIEVQILYQIMSAPPNQERELIIDTKLREMEKKIIEIGQDPTLSDAERNQKMLQLVQQSYASGSQNIYRATILKIIPNPVDASDLSKTTPTAKGSSATKKATTRRKS